MTDIDKKPIKFHVTFKENVMLKTIMEVKNVKEYIARLSNSKAGRSIIGNRITKVFYKLA